MENANIGWFAFIGADHAIDTVPGLHIVYEYDMPISPLG
jgi:hypothetical protein